MNAFAGIGKIFWVPQSWPTAVSSTDMEAIYVGTTNPDINNQHRCHDWGSGKRDSKAYLQHNKTSNVLVPCQMEGYTSITTFTLQVVSSFVTAYLCDIGVARGRQRGHGSLKFLENIVILCFERRFSKQNVVIRLQSNILASPKIFAPQIFGLATSLLCELAFSILLNIKRKRLPCEIDMRIALPETKPRISQIVARK